MNDQFEATGRYERPVSPLAIAFSSPFHALAKPEPYRVTYHGTIRGRAILAHVTRAREGEPPQQTSLLGSVGGQEPKVLMLIADDETEIRAMEVSQSGKPRFYSLAPVRERQPSS